MTAEKGPSKKCSWCLFKAKFGALKCLHGSTATAIITSFVGLETAPKHAHLHTIRKATVRITIPRRLCVAAVAMVCVST